MQISTFIATLFAITAIAAPAAPVEDGEVHILPILEPRAAATCGSVSYSAAAVSAASQRACSNAASGSAPGGYPHAFNNREGFSFAAAGPYLEFPIMKGGALYTGGSPGPDRVVITKNGCKEAGTITHTGASGNNFVKCR